MRKVICLLLAAILMLSLTAPVFAASDAASGTCGDTITWHYGNGTLTIRGTGALKLQSNGMPYDSYRKQIRKLVVEDGITTLGYCCFLNYVELESVQLPDSLTTIGAQTFQGCDKLKEIYLPKNVKYIGDVQGSPATTFSGDLMERILVDEENTRYYSVDGVLFDRRTNALICFPLGKRCDNYSVPAGTQEITYGGLWFYQGESLHLPDGLQVIDSSAFSASKFKTLVLPDTVTSIGKSAFNNCDRLTEITLPASVSKVDSDAFGSCEALDVITILNPDCELAASGNTLSSNSKIRGALNSTAHAYAKQYGRDFIDIDTGKLYVYDSGNASYIALLPKDVGGTSPAFSLFCFANEAGVITGYQPKIAVELDKTNVTYQEMLAFTRNLTKNCTTDYAKARAVCQWVNGNMTYVFGMMGTGTTAEGVYNIWKNRHGNCMGYTQLTNFMLYLLDIPTATVTSYGHCWSAALINGEWIMVDSTNNIFDAPPDSFEDIEDITFAVNDNLVCVINDLTGVKLASYGISIYDHQLESEIVIPDYIVYIYKSVFFLEDCYETVTTHLTIRGTAGSYAESYLREKLPHYTDYTYENGMFTAKVGKVWTEDDAINLLRHVLFPDMYAIQGNMDFNKDGSLTEDDAILLLRHILFPELYPL